MGGCEPSISVGVDFVVWVDIFIVVLWLFRALKDDPLLTVVSSRVGRVLVIGFVDTVDSVLDESA